MIQLTRLLKKLKYGSEVKMNTFENNAFFWQKLDTLLLSSHFELTQVAGSKHPQYANLIYPVDYGILKDTQTQDHPGISMYKGSITSHKVNAVIIAADILNKDVQIKFLVGCTAEQEENILRFLNQTDYQKTVLIRRSTEVPSWGLSD